MTFAGKATSGTRKLKRTVYLSRTSTVSMFSTALRCHSMPMAGVFDAQDVELHRLGIDLPAVVEQHALAQPEHPGGEVLVGLPALGDARDDVALLIDIGEAGVHRRRWMRGVQLIMAMRVEARG